MREPKPEEFLIFWYRALRAEHGVVIATDKPFDLQARMYEARKEIADPKLACLSIFVPQPGTEIFIYKRHDAELP